MEFLSEKDVANWLRKKPRDVAVVIAARAAMRSVPGLNGIRDFDLANRAEVLSVFRDLALTWTTVRYRLGRKFVIRAALVFAASTADAAARNAARAAYMTVASDEFEIAAAITVDSAANCALWAAPFRGRVAQKAIYHATSADSLFIDLGITPASLAGGRLWNSRQHKWAREHWTQLKLRLLSLDEDWDVWTDWYEARLGGNTRNEAIELEHALIAEELFDKGPKNVNAAIKRQIGTKDSRGPRASNPQEPLLHPDKLLGSQIDIVPSQGPGPRFRGTDKGPVDRAPPADLDPEGNDTRTIDRLKPLALRCAADLKMRLPSNQFGELLSAVDLYVAALSPGEGKTTEWGEVWGLGVYLQNAASASERKVDGRIFPALEDPAKTALDSLLTIHGPMILATRDGARFSEQASGFQLTREQQEALRVAAQRVAEQLKADKQVITPRAAESVERATESIGQGPHPERGSVYGLATVKNISIVLVGGAAIATPVLIGALLGSVVGALAGAPFSFVAVEAVKKSPAFNALVTQLGASLDAMTDVELRAWMEERGRRYAPFRRFVARNAEPLRKIAEATPELKWMLRYIEFIADKPETK